MVPGDRQDPGLHFCATRDVWSLKLQVTVCEAVWDRL